MTALDLRRDPGRTLKLLPAMSPADERAVAREDIRAITRAMSTEAFRQGGRGAAHDLRLEALPWDIDLKAICVPVDVWHGLDDTIVRWEHAEILADAIPGAQRHLR